MNQPNPSNKVSLEELLRLKRAERPDPEFWNHFEQQLRAKQLASIMVRKPWWQDLSSVWSRFARLQLPVGAAAVLAVTFLVVREYRPWASSAVSRPADTEAVALASPSALVGVAGGAEERGVAVASTHAETAAVETSVPVAAVAPAVDVGTLSVTRRLSGELTPSARSIAANLAAVEASGEADGVLFGSGSLTNFERQVAQGRQATAEPLAQMASPRDARRARLMAALDSHSRLTTGDNSGVVRSRDRIASRIEEDQLYDSVSRLGVGGDRLTLKF